MVYIECPYFIDIQIMNGTLAHDSVTAKALGYKRQEIDIYSNSWGPSDNGHLVNGPGPLVKEALMEGAKWVRLHYLIVHLLKNGIFFIRVICAAYSNYFPSCFDLP